MKKYVCIVLCIFSALIFTSCKNSAEITASTKEGVSATEQGDKNETSSSSANETSQKPSQASDKEEKTTSQARSENESTSQKPREQTDSIPISIDEALDKLRDFYGAAYDVSATEKDGSVQRYEVKDKKQNLYAVVEVNLETSDAKEKIIHSDEINEFNLSV